jgi:hypothetical protein
LPRNSGIVLCNTSACLDGCACGSECRMRPPQLAAPANAAQKGKEASAHLLFAVSFYFLESTATFLLLPCLRKVLCQPKGPMPTERSYANQKALCQPKGPVPTQRSYANRKVLCQPKGPMPTGRSYTNRKVLCQPKGPMPTQRSHTNRKVLYQPEGPAPTGCADVCLGQVHAKLELPA